MKNLFKAIIFELISTMEEEDKLDTLTQIGIATKDYLVFEACEEIRNELFPEEASESKKTLGVRAIRKRKTDRDILETGSDGEDKSDDPMILMAEA